MDSRTWSVVAKLYHPLLRALRTVTVICFLLVSQESFAQSENENGPPDSRTSYEFGVHFGTLLSQRIGVTEPVPGWALKAGMPTLSGVFEAGIYLGNGNGISYRSASFDYRLPFEFDVITGHVLLGVHADQYATDFPRPASSKFSGGWHYGGGVSQHIVGPVLLRADFRHRFGPGISLEATLGLSIRFAAGNL